MGANDRGSGAGFPKIGTVVGAKPMDAATEAEMPSCDSKAMLTGVGRELVQMGRGASREGLR